MRAYVERMNREREKLRMMPWPMRIGVHTGPVMAGVVGKRKFTYDVWGDAVNTAQLMEERGEPGRINVSDATHERTKGLFEFEPYKSVETRSGMCVAMYTLLRIRPELAADADGVTPNARFRELAAA
jgi:class 3 adenylate cyclase